ncbi:MAG TPA: exosortase F system-associated protein [Flavobacteriaceae bacterium]|nr:exosortase F system-associated protein [Flavobacteriaceae bacterium]HPF11048.1 exosortase F system-associated protein [Flavobacteriaceae bacterium]HQU22117.1 exosortase F system-associated protein [Flavobacteriaceae bacterium]HQU64275.1 exosortase F system-associated protein [Flavobacteriaceae bacterium]HRW44286.1 exosortase F system-associated protein [Flavobacteriaceae bacterium]
MAKGVRVIGILLLVGVLVLVRAYAPVLFYDPLILFFKSAYATQPLLELDFWGLLWSVSLRFWLNSSISLVILWLWFQKRDVVRFSLLLYGLAFVLLLLAFVVLLQTSEAGGMQPLFYVRRFLIHPILLLLLVPGFYFYGSNKF